MPSGTDETPAPQHQCCRFLFIMYIWVLRLPALAFRREYPSRRFISARCWPAFADLPFLCCCYFWCKRLVVSADQQQAWTALGCLRSSAVAFQLVQLQSIDTLTTRFLYQQQTEVVWKARLLKYRDQPNTIAFSPPTSRRLSTR